MTATTDPIDHKALRLKYREERDKRLRREGQKQYVQPVDDFQSVYEGDPYMLVQPREALTREVEVAVLEEFEIGDEARIGRIAAHLLERAQPGAERAESHGGRLCRGAGVAKHRVVQRLRTNSARSTSPLIPG